MIVYLDNNYICHLEDAPGRISIETDAFDGKCKQVIENYRFIPSGASWARSDGTVFHGEMMSPANSSTTLETLQKAYREAKKVEETRVSQIIFVYKQNKVYHRGDFVQNDNVIYYCLGDTTMPPPRASYWRVSSLEEYFNSIQ